MPCRLLSVCLTVLLALVPAVAQSPVGRVIPGRFLVVYRDGVLPADAADRAVHAGARVVRSHSHLGMAVVQASGSNAAIRTALLQDPSVEFAVQDRIVSAHAISVRAASASNTADSLYNSPQGWAVRQVGGFGVAGGRGPWSISRGAGVRIAILDSGVDASHPDIAPNLQLNLSEIDQSAATGLPSACDDGSPADQQGHGTWSASLAAGALGPGTGSVVGVAPAATLLNIKVLERLPSAAGDCDSGQASGLMSWVLAGIDDATANGANIISMSLGTLVDITTGEGAGLKTLFDRATHAAANAGVLLIAAAGNDGFNFANQQYVELPAMARDVLAVVASTNPACAENLAKEAACVPGPMTLPYYSNFGAPLNALAAPGGSYPAGSDPDPTQTSGWIWGACSDGLAGTISGLPSTPGQSFGCFNLGHASYVQAMGTSASAPLAAGAAALLLGSNPGWSAAQLGAALRSSAIQIPGLPVPLLGVAGLLTPAPHDQHVGATNQR